MRYLLILASIFMASSMYADDSTKPGATRVARWAGDKTGCFLVMFDDGWPSLWQVAAPELKKRGMIGTFYIVPDKGEYKKFRDKWEGPKGIWTQGMVYGNHTMTHNGFQSYEDAKAEVADCNAVILKTVPGPQVRLVSWGKPGVKDWKVTKEQLADILKTNHLISRPPFAGHGVVYHLKTPKQMLDLADKAIASKGLEYVVAHGVERGPDMNWGYQDFWAWKQESFKAVLDGLVERRDRGDLWITDHISSHKYATERDAATVEVKAAKDVIKVKLACSADPQLYDHPLTLVTQLPSSWQGCKVSQNGKELQVASVNQSARYDAMPGVITLTRTGK